MNAPTVRIVQAVNQNYGSRGHCPGFVPTNDSLVARVARSNLSLKIKSYGTPSLLRVEVKPFGREPFKSLEEALVGNFGEAAQETVYKVQYKRSFGNMY